MSQVIERENLRWNNFREATWPARKPHPCWATANQAVPISDTVTLRAFGDPSDRLPVLVVTPQVNHSYIADFAPGQSLVRTLLGAGPRRVGVTEWLAPPVNRRYTIADSLDDIRACMDRLGPRVHVVGLCQGGWQVTMIAALYPETCASLTIAAAPIDAHAGSTLLHLYTLGLPFAFFENLVACSGGNVPGRLFTRGFNGLKWFERTLYNPSILYLCADDCGFVGRHKALQDWYRLDKDVAGALYLEAVKGLFMENRLAKNTFRVGDRTVDLTRIACPIHMLAGTRDHITPREQVFALKALAPQVESHEYLVEAGHIGVFMGRSALSLVWPVVAASLE